MDTTTGVRRDVPLTVRENGRTRWTVTDDTLAGVRSVGRAPVIAAVDPRTGAISTAPDLCPDPTTTSVRLVGDRVVLRCTDDDGTRSPRSQIVVLGPSTR